MSLATSGLGRRVVQAGPGHEVRVVAGPRLLAGIDDGADLAAHRRRWPTPLRLTPRQLLAGLRPARIGGHGSGTVGSGSSSGIGGRGGDAPAFIGQLELVLRGGRRRELVVNLACGEPGSAKDGVLAVMAPHLVLDGAELVAEVVQVRTIHLVVPGDRPIVAAAMRRAMSERDRFRYDLRQTSADFLGGQSSAVIELLQGRENLPRTAWAPIAVHGLHGRPTLLADAETFAQVAILHRLGAAYGELGTGSEPGTTVLSVAADRVGGTVLEVPHGVRLAEVMQFCGQDPRLPLLVGGYHGAWLPPEHALKAQASRIELARLGLRLRAGALIPLAPGECPVVRTAQIAAYLAARSSGRCGPCRLGLPTLAHATEALAAPGPERDELAGFDLGSGADRAAERMSELVPVLSGRGACAHPDRTSGLVDSMMRAYPGEVAVHRRGGCAVAAGEAAR